MNERRIVSSVLPADLYGAVLERAHAEERGVSATVCDLLELALDLRFSSGDRSASPPAGRGFVGAAPTPAGHPH